ncbi:MAG: class I SAM-dependent methyltransferase [Acidimicrobiales bacterium]
MHAKLLGAVRPKRILELGVFTGGSLAMSGLAPTLDKVVGIELETRPLKSLEDFISANHLSETIQPYLGVDQADRHTLDRIMETEFSGQPLDLVIDDASHLLEPTRLSFEALFPRLRSGGVYIIEDWAAGHLADFTANAASDTAMKRAVRLDSVKPLSILAFELTLATARNPQLFPRLEINRHWIRITKGDSKTSFHLDDFRLAEHYVDPFGLVPRLATS